MLRDGFARKLRAELPDSAEATGISGAWCGGFRESRIERIRRGRAASARAMPQAPLRGPGVLPGLPPGLAPPRGARHADPTAPPQGRLRAARPVQTPSRGSACTRAGGGGRGANQPSGQRRLAGYPKRHTTPQERRDLDGVRVGEAPWSLRPAGLRSPPRAQRRACHTRASYVHGNTRDAFRRFGRCSYTCCDPQPSVS